MNFYLYSMIYLSVYVLWSIYLNHYFLFLCFRESVDSVKQCAALCLLKLFRINESVVPRTAEWASRICQMLNDPNLVNIEFYLEENINKGLVLPIIITTLVHSRRS